MSLSTGKAVMGEGREGKEAFQAGLRKGGALPSPGIMFRVGSAGAPDSISGAP